MAVSQGSILVLILGIALTVDYARSQTYGPGPATGTVSMGTTDMMMTTATVAAGEVEPVEPGEEVFTTTQQPTTTKKPKPKPRKRPKSRRRRPKNLKPKPKGRRRQKGVKPGRKQKPKATTQKPTPAPTLAPTTAKPTAAPTPAPTPAPVVQQAVAIKPAQGRSGGGQYAASANGAAPAAYPQPEVRVVPQVYHQPVPTTTPAPATKSPNQYLYEPHSCPKMDVATWENEVVIYDNRNCAIIVRMNPRLRRPTVTFQAPYW